MEAKIQKWGNSLAVRIPKALAKNIDVRNGSAVDIDTSEGQIIIRPIKRYDLSVMLAAVTKENLHQEVDTGAPVGREEM
jgi:antitoxin MazE